MSSSITPPGWRTYAASGARRSPPRMRAAERSRLRQGDRLLAVADAAFASTSPDSPTFADDTFPGYPGPDEIESPTDAVPLVPMRGRYEYRHVTGAPWDGPASQAETGGWIRLAE